MTVSELGAVRPGRLIFQGVTIFDDSLPAPFRVLISDGLNLLEAEGFFGHDECVS